MVTKEAGYNYWTSPPVVSNRARHILGNARQNPTKGRVAFSWFSARFLSPYLPDCLQNAITFFYLVSVEFGKVCLTKVFTLSVFQKKFWVCLFPTIFTLIFQKIESFLPKIAYIGGKQTNYKNKFLNEKFECFRCFFIHWLY